MDEPVTLHCPCGAWVFNVFIRESDMTLRCAMCQRIPDTPSDLPIYRDPS